MIIKPSYLRSPKQTKALTAEREITGRLTTKQRVSHPSQRSELEATRRAVPELR